MRVSVEAAEGEVALEVHNSGPPIPAAVLPVLFQPFRRGPFRDRSPRGLGLGLYIAEQIVRAHSGAITVASTEQTGTTFTVRLPRAHAGAERP